MSIVIRARDTMQLAHGNFKVSNSQLRSPRSPQVSNCTAPARFT